MKPPRTSLIMTAVEKARKGHVPVLDWSALLDEIEADAVACEDTHLKDLVTIARENIARGQREVSPLTDSLLAEILRPVNLDTHLVQMEIEVGSPHGLYVLHGEDVSLRTWEIDVRVIADNNMPRVTFRAREGASS